MRDRPLSAGRPPSAPSVRKHHATRLPSARGSRAEDSGSARPQHPDSSGEPSKLPYCKEFHHFVDRAVESCTQGAGDEGTAEEVRQILTNLRKQFDELHSEAEKKEADLLQLREDIRAAERALDVRDPDNSREVMSAKVEEVTSDIADRAETKLVYEHMLNRLRKEVVILRQKVGKLDTHLERKNREVERRLTDSHAVHQKKMEVIADLESMEQDMEQERRVRSEAYSSIQDTLRQKRRDVRRRGDFDRWRHEVALEAANSAFLASAGRLRKLYAVEKLVGNCLQRIIFEQVERSQVTEDGFQRIREATGLTDVMDIVHKFLNRETEHQQLRASVKESEEQLQNLSQDLLRSKKEKEEELELESKTFGRQYRDLYFSQEQGQAKLLEAQKEDVVCRQRLNDSTLLLERVKRWATGMGQSLATFQDREHPICIEKLEDIVPVFEQLEKAVDGFLAFTEKQLPPAKLLKMAAQASSREFHEQARLLTDKEFVKVNCRVQASLDNQRSVHGHETDAIEDQTVLIREREHMKIEASKRQQAQASTKGQAQGNKEKAFQKLDVSHGKTRSRAGGSM